MLEPMVLNSSVSQTDNEKLIFNMGGASGEGYVTTEGFVLLAGARLNENFVKTIILTEPNLS